MRVTLAAFALALACAGTASAEPRSFTGFTRVDASAGTEVTVTVAPNYSVDVSGPGADQVVTRISGQTLVIERPHGFHWGPRPRAHVTVTMPRVEGLTASSGAELVVSGVDASNIALDSSSGAELRVSGRCQTFSADASSGANVYAQDLRCESGGVDASSGGNARVFATGRLNVDASSGGGVVAYGNPGIGDIDLSSGGSLRRAD